MLRSEVVNAAGLCPPAGWGLYPGEFLALGSNVLDTPLGLLGDDVVENARGLGGDFGHDDAGAAELPCPNHAGHDRAGEAGGARHARRPAWPVVAIEEIPDDSLFLATLCSIDNHAHDS